MKCTITTEKRGAEFTYGLTEENERIKVLAGHLFHGKVVGVEKYNDNFYKIKKLNNEYYCLFCLFNFSFTD